jgi:fumarate reductase flavoprotein subunit
MEMEPNVPQIGDIPGQKTNRPAPSFTMSGGVLRRKNIVPERQFSFEIPPEPIPSGDIKETVSTEIVIVGAGISGTCAAVSAAEEGAKVILLEKQKTFQGFGGHNAAIGSRLQKKLGIEIDREDVIANLMRYAANKPDQRLIRMWAYESGETMDWLMDMTDAEGLKVTIDHFPPPADFNNNKYYPHYLVTHDFDFKERLVVKCLLENAVKKGVKVYFETGARQLIRKGKGGIIGIIARDHEGNYINFEAKKAVVLCTGDYANNSEMVAKYCPEVEELGTLVNSSTGDGHQMAMWVGAVMEPAPHAIMIHGPAGPLGSDPFLQVNIKGERFQNEDVPCELISIAIRRQPGQVIWQIFDSKYPEELPFMGIGHLRVDRMTDELREFIEKHVIKADTIEELAEKMGLPVNNFKATITRYNELVKIGKDLDFGKSANKLTAVDRPPYYAGKGQALFFGAMGGLNVNPSMQALDKDGNVISGLYLGGNIVGNRYGVVYPSMLPGLSNGMAQFFGRLAGLNAAKPESQI